MISGSSTGPTDFFLYRPFLLLHLQIMMALSVQSNTKDFGEPKMTPLFMYRFATRQKACGSLS